ncbi:MAG: hypothetical protein WC979_06360 [Candidatus Pacearchaeota archaeon]|jgi:hypothetical protein
MGIKLFAYAAAIIGLIGIAISTPKVYAALSFLSVIESKYFLIVGVILVGVGVILVSSSGSGKSKGKEVPIYKGKEVIGYRIVK